MKGYFTMPYQYLEEENLSDDFWTIRVVEVPKTARGRSKKKIIQPGTTGNPSAVAVFPADPVFQEVGGIFLKSRLERIRCKEKVGFAFLI